MEVQSNRNKYDSVKIAGTAFKINKQFPKMKYKEIKEQAVMDKSNDIYFFNSECSICLDKI